MGKERKGKGAHEADPVDCIEWPVSNNVLTAWLYCEHVPPSGSLQRKAVIRPLHLLQESVQVREPGLI